MDGVTVSQQQQQQQLHVHMMMMILGHKKRHSLRSGAVPNQSIIDCKEGTTTNPDNNTDTDTDTKKSQKPELNQMKCCQTHTSRLESATDRDRQTDSAV